MKKLQIFIQFLFFISIFLFNSSTLLGMEFPTIKKLESLQQKDFTGATLDCGYFAIYNAVQMVDSSNKNEQILQKTLLKKDQFQNNYDIWKLEFKTFLSADEIEKILNKKKLRLPVNQIFVLGDPNLFEALKKAANSYTELKNITKIDLSSTKLQDLIIKLYNSKTPFAIIYRLKNMPHWITYGVRANNGSFQVFYTNSLNQPAILPEEVKAALTKAESDDERKAILESAKEFEDQRKQIEKSSEENAKIILKLLEDYKKQLPPQIKIPTTFSRPLEDIFKATIPEAQRDEFSQSLAQSKFSDSWIEAEKEFNEKQGKILDAEKELQKKKDEEEAEKETARKIKENIWQEEQRLKSPTLSAEDEKEKIKKAQEALGFLRTKLEKLRTNLNESTVIIENKEKHVENQEKALEKATEAFKEGKEILLTISKTQSIEIKMPSELTDMEAKIKQNKEKITQEKKDLKQTEEELKQIEQEVKTYTANLYRIETPIEKEKEKEIQISEQERQKELKRQEAKLRLEQERKRQAEEQARLREAEEERIKEQQKRQQKLIEEQRKKDEEARQKLLTEQQRRQAEELRRKEEFLKQEAEKQHLEQQRQIKLQRQLHEEEQKRAEQARREAEERESEDLVRKLEAEEAQKLEEEKPTKEKMELPQNIRKQVAEKLNAAQLQLNRKSIIGATQPFKETINLLEKNKILTQEKAVQLQRNFKAPLGQAQKTLQEVQDLLK